MAKAQYAVVGGTTRKITKKYAVVNGETRKITKEYAVIDGKTRLIYSIGGGLLVTGRYSSPITYYALKSDGGTSWEEIEAGENSASTLSSTSYNNVRCYFWKGRYIRYNGNYWYSLDGSVWTLAPADSTITVHSQVYELRSDTSTQCFLTDDIMYNPCYYQIQTSETGYRKYHYVRKIDSNFNSTYIPVTQSDNDTGEGMLVERTEYSYNCFCHYIDPSTKVGTYYVLGRCYITTGISGGSSSKTSLYTWNGSSANLSIKQENLSSLNGTSQMTQFGSTILIITSNNIYEYIPSGNTITSLFSVPGSTSSEKAKNHMQKIDDTHFVIYNTKLNKVFYYANSGSAWTRVSTGTLPSINGDYRTVVQFIENTMYIISYESDSSAIKYINYSNDFGITWTQKVIIDLNKTVSTHYAFLWTEQEAKAGD